MPIAPPRAIQPIKPVNIVTANVASVETDLTGIYPGLGLNARSNIAGGALGDWAIELTNNGASPGDLYVFIIINTIIPGVTYTFRFDTKAATTARQVTPYINFYTAASALVLTATGPVFTNTVGTWVTHYVTYTAPPSASFAYCLSHISLAAVNEKHYLDKLGFTVGANTEFAMPGRLTPGRP